jgi:hypothetical protein
VTGQTDPADYRDRDLHELHAHEARAAAGYAEGPSFTQCGAVHDGTDQAGHSHYRDGTCDDEPPYAMGGPA